MSEMAPERTVGGCKCGRPTRDQAYVCDTCLDALTRALAECPWAEDELAVTVTGQRGIDYRKLGGSPSSETAIPLHVGAVEATAHLRSILRLWVKFCCEERVRNQSPRVGLPADSIAATSRWLMWRVDGIGLHEAGPDAVDEITSAVARAKRTVDRPADKWYAGPCDKCQADLYARAQTGQVACGEAECDASYDIAERRAWLLEAAEDRLLSAADISRAVSWLGTAPLTPNRVRLWASRGRILAHGHDGNSPLYRVGDAINLLSGNTPGRIDGTA